MSVELIGTDWRAIGEAKANSRKFKKPNSIDYKILARRFELRGKTALAELAWKAAQYANQLTA